MPTPPSSLCMIMQYNSIKHDPTYEGHVVLIQMGDFFEAFHEDAVVVSRVLGLTLTKRRGTPMAGEHVA